MHLHRCISLRSLYRISFSLLKMGVPKKRFEHLWVLVRYADDFVILCRKKPQAEEALKAVKWIMNKLELTLHSEKTRLVDMYFGKDSFDFLGFNNRQD